MTRYALYLKELFPIHKNFILKRIFIGSILIFFVSFLNAEIFSDTKFGYLLDLPQGFILEDSVQTENKTQYLLSQKGSPIQLIINIISDTQIKRASDALYDSLIKLQSNYHIDKFIWNKSECCISDFSFNFEKDFSGWAICAPLKNENQFVVLMCYTPAKEKQAWEPMIMSTLNSLSVDLTNLLTPGPILTYAYPRENEKNISFQIDDTTINSKIDYYDIEASNFLVDMEFSVLTKYANHKDWKEAWCRYYQMIYKDSYGRLQNVYLDIIETLYPIALEKNPHNVDLQFAQMILSWVQDFEYKRDNTDARNSDFTSLPAVLCGEGNDCDSRSLLVSSILNTAGYESFILISRQYSHAMTCVELSAPGQKYIPAKTDREFLMGETTDSVTWGMIPKDFSDKSKWIPVFLP